MGYDTQTGDGDKAAFDEVLEAEMDELSVRDREFYLGLPGKTGGNVSSHTYGLLAWDQGMEIVVPLITRNSEIPFMLESQPGQFGTAENNQTTIEIVMMESDGDPLDPDDCKESGRGTVELPPGIPRGSEVEIRFDYADDGTMMLAAREVTSNSECEVAIVRNGIMDPDQVQAAGNQLAVMVAG